MRKHIGIWILALVVLAVATFVIWRYATRPAEQVALAPASASSAPDAVEQAPDFPIASAANDLPTSASTAPLPPLAASDSRVVAGLSALVGNSGLDQLLVSQAVIPRIVATIDALPRKRLSERNLPLATAAGPLPTTEVDGVRVIASENATRYAPYMAVAERAETDDVVAWYVRHYPLFQQAYRDLGYADGYFNDRLVFVIDHLLATPAPTAALAVVPYKGEWAFADPRLEGLSAGQKLLLRAGPDNARILKARLRELREALTGQDQNLPGS